MTARDESPRTDAEPMAFTTSEFLRGARGAWLAFLALDLAAWCFVAFPYALLVAGMFATFVSAIALAVFLWPALLLGHALQRVTRIPVHLWAFAGLGFVIGVSTTLVFTAITGGFDASYWLSGSWLMLAINTIAATIAVPWGWWRTARRALRVDSGIVAACDPDADAEDAALDQRG